MSTSIRVGPAGWSYEDWRRIVYPAARQPGFHEAAHLAQYFKAIEINTSFYRPLRPELASLWVKKLESHPQFQFTAKLFRGFTHDQNLSRTDVKSFSDGLAPLVDAGRLGCVLMQFPWSFRFHRANRDYLIRLTRAFGHYPLVAEMRHASWNCSEALDIFIDHHIGVCNIDQPQLDHCFPPTAHATSPIGYFRLHGRNYQEWFNFDSESSSREGLSAIQARYNYLYSREQLEKWKTRIEQVAEQTRKTYVITNNHFRGQAVVNAFQLVEILSGEPVDVPVELLEHYPELQASARNAPNQGSLFSAPPACRQSGSQGGRSDRPFLVAASGGSK